MITTAPHQYRIRLTAGQINRAWRAEVKRADEAAGDLQMQLSINRGLRAEIERLKAARVVE